MVKGVKGGWGPTHTLYSSSCSPPPWLVPWVGGCTAVCQAHDDEGMVGVMVVAAAIADGMAGCWYHIIIIMLHHGWVGGP